jgi:hypothetical protein
MEEAYGYTRVNPLKRAVQNSIRALVTLVIVCAIAAVALGIATLIFLPGIYVRQDRVALAVENQGFTSVEIVDKSVVFVGWKGCGSGDDAAFNVRATNAQGKRVDLVACAGWHFKGVTIRSK